MEIIYRCECCQEEFDDETECLEHEDNCCEDEGKSVDTFILNKMCCSCQNFCIENFIDNTYKLKCLKQNYDFMKQDKNTNCTYYLHTNKKMIYEVFI